MSDNTIFYIAFYINLYCHEDLSFENINQIMERLDCWMYHYKGEWIKDENNILYDIRGRIDSFIKGKLIECSSRESNNIFVLQIDNCLNLSDIEIIDKVNYYIFSFIKIIQEKTFMSFNIERIDLSDFKDRVIHVIPDEIIYHEVDRI